MENDDEFGDLYTDVLKPFAPSSSPSRQPLPQHQEPSLLHSLDTDVHHAPLIPGLSATAEQPSKRLDAAADDLDDSDDDLKIVLDDTVEHDGGENSMQPNAGESVKAIVYSNQGSHHPLHSQFKYVGPVAAPIPAATTSAPGGPSGQIRPLANMNPVVGHGRGDWKPAGIKGAASMLKGFQAGRGSGGGLEFMLPSHKIIFDVDIDSFEKKPWKYPGVDVSDFFNFGLNEDTWKDYCKQLEQLCLESTMQSKIHVYESGRTEQDHDPDLPPELASASGIRDVSVDNANSVKSDVGQNDLIKGSGLMQPPIPTGSAIQVESGSGDRLPSIDTQPPRIRDSDAIIEIVLQDPANDDSNARSDVQDKEEDGEPQRPDYSEDRVVGHEIPRQMLGRVCDQSPHITCSREAMRHRDQLKKTDRNNGESPHHKSQNDTYVRGNQYRSEERQPRKEKSSSRGDCAANAVDSQRVHQRKRDEGSRKSKDPIVGSLDSLGTSEIIPENQSGQINDKLKKQSVRCKLPMPSEPLPSAKNENPMDSEVKQERPARKRRWISN